MRRLTACFLMVLLPLFTQAQSQTNSDSQNQSADTNEGGNTYQTELAKIQWQKGPTRGTIANNASIKVPAGFVFLDEKNTNHYLVLNDNPPSTGNYLIAPESLEWFAVFSFEETGYIKDDEKINADDLLNELRSSDEESNELRNALSMSAIYTDGWEVKPHYDAATKRLEWGLRLRTDDNEKIVNYTARLLGRRGVMSAILVSSPESLSTDVAAFKTLLKDFEYNTGESYTEFKQGDKLAEYGLAALVLGGAAAVATKKGFWGAIAAFLAAGWKIIAGVLIAALMGIKSLFSRKR